MDISHVLFKSAPKTNSFDLIWSTSRVDLWRKSISINNSFAPPPANLSFRVVWRSYPTSKTVSDFIRKSVVQSFNSFTFFYRKSLHSVKWNYTKFDRTFVSMSLNVCFCHRYQRWLHVVHMSDNGVEGWKKQFDQQAVVKMNKKASKFLSSCSCIMDLRSCGCDARSQQAASKINFSKHDSHD